MKLTSLFHIRKSRKYPIKRDQEGFSLRARYFELFRQGKRPVEVAEELKADEATVFRYFRDWKKLGHNFDQFYAYVNSLLNSKSPDRDKHIDLFAQVLGVSKEQFEAILAQPHGLKQLMTGKLYMPAHADADHKRHIVLELALLMSDFLIKEGGKFEDIYFALKLYMTEHKKSREERDAEIQKHNAIMKIFHIVLAKELENERQGQVKPDMFTEEERRFSINWSMNKEMRETGLYYWFRLYTFIAQGLSEEEAREKILQGVIDKDNPKVIKVFREFQNNVHPLKTDGQAPSSPHSQPPSTT